MPVLTLLPAQRWLCGLRSIVRISFWFHAAQPPQD